MASKNLTRIEFLKISAGFVGVSAMPFTFGCPSDDTSDDGAGTTETPGTTEAPGTTTETPGTTTETPGTTTGDPDSSSGTPPGTDTGSSSGTPGTESSSGGETSPSACTMDPDVTIGSNHGHEMVVPLADVMAGVQVVYNIQGTSMHNHSVTLTAEDLMMLSQGMQVMVDSSTDAMHSHPITVICG